MTYQYGTREGFKRVIQIQDPNDDHEIDIGLVTATTVLDMVTGRRFQPYLATRTIEIPHGQQSTRHLLLHADLLEITSLQTDDGSWTYPYTWDTGTWRLGPEDHAYKNPPEAYYWIQRSPSAPYGWPCGLTGGVQIAGKWGFYDQRRASGATLSAAIDATVVTIPVTPSGVFDVGHTILIGAEQMYVTAKNATALTVEARGANGTTAAAHPSGVAIQIYTYPAIEQACLKLTQRYLRSLKDAALGFVGGADGLMRLAYNDPDVMGMLAGFTLTAMR